MSFNIVDLVKNYITPDMVSKAGSFLGESESGISKAVSAIIPTLLGGVATEANASQDKASSLLDTAKGLFSSGILSNTNSLLGNGDLLSKGSSIISSLFGGKSQSIIDMIANFAGIKSSSSSSILSMLTPLVLGFLGKKATEDNMNASSFSGFLSSEKSNILGSLPSGLAAIGSFFGLGAAADTVSHATHTVKESASSAYHHVEDKVEEASGGGMKWLLPLLLVAALGLAIWYFTSKGCNKTADTVTTSADSSNINHGGDTLNVVVPSGLGSLDTLSGNYIYNVGADTEIKLADGTLLKVGENSTEARLFKFLSDANAAVDTVDKSKGWIVLDRVYFETGKSVLTAASQNQLKNIAAILKNFPTAEVKMGGYTDNTGPADVNTKVSGERAKAAASEIIKLGATAASVSSEGYGPLHPVCAANDTPECKAQNRRVDIRVAKK